MLTAGDFASETAPGMLAVRSAAEPVDRLIKRPRVPGGHAFSQQGFPEQVICESLTTHSRGVQPIMQDSRATAASVHIECLTVTQETRDAGQIGHEANGN